MPKQSVSDPSNATRSIGLPRGAAQGPQIHALGHATRSAIGTGRRRGEADPRVSREVGGSIRRAGRKAAGLEPRLNAGACLKALVISCYGS
mmetsp:Transcript_14526/g.34490  ORF Transcript_14526/g.34490 Transcript_14526/m.34490 type:complete len:91 (+) Transcript_14526:473-745(+)